MRAGVQETIDVFVTNESEDVWRWGKDARPEIRLAYRWSDHGETVHETMALRTALPADLAPGSTQCVPLHVVPPGQAGRYSLELQLVHEGVCCFGSTIPAELEVYERDLLAIVGAPALIAAQLAELAAPPHVEPVVVLGNDSDRNLYGDFPTVSGLRAPLLGDLETAEKLSRTIKLLWRSLTIIRRARRYRRRGTTSDARLAPLFDVLQRSRALLIAGPDWPDNAAPGREWWLLATTLLASRAIGRPVYASDAATPTETGTRNAMFRRLIRHYSNPTEKTLGQYLGRTPRRPDATAEPEMPVELVR
jgi:hypothetical protein